MPETNRRKKRVSLCKVQSVDVKGEKCEKCENKCEMYTGTRVHSFLLSSTTTNWWTRIGVVVVVKEQDKAQQVDRGIKKGVLCFDQQIINRLIPPNTTFLISICGG